VPVYDRVPHGRKSNVFCLLNDDANVKLRHSGKKSTYNDDCRIWDSSKGTTTKFPYLSCPGGEYKRLFLHNGEYCYERLSKGTRQYVPDTPQPEESEIIVLCRYYCVQKGNPSYRKRVSWLLDKSLCKRSLAVVEYIGEPVNEPPAHGNSKNEVKGYVRTPATTMSEISENVKGKSCKVVYEEAVEEMDVLDAPRDSRVVRNKKYTNSVQSRKCGSEFKATFADEVQTVCAPWCRMTILCRL